MLFSVSPKSGHFVTSDPQEVGPVLFTARAVSQCGPVTYLSHTPLFTVASTGKVQCREMLLAGDYIIEITAQIRGKIRDL